MHLTTAQIREKYQKLSAERTILTENVEASRGHIEALNKAQNTIKLTHAFVKKIAQDAQNEFKTEVDTAVTMAVKTIFEENFFFDLDIKTGGSGLQCYPKIWEHVDGVDVEYVPKDEMGGSIIDPIGFTLRVTLQAFDPEPTRPTFILDEPMKHVGKGELLERAGRLLREISHGMKRQLIIITHEPELAEIADRAWRVVRRRGRSVATVIKEGAAKRKLIS